MGDQITKYFHKSYQNIRNKYQIEGRYFLVPPPPPPYHVNTHEKIIQVLCRLDDGMTHFMTSIYILLLNLTFITSPPIGGGRGIVMPMSVCVFVCVFVCLFVRVFAKFQSVISQPFLNRSL